MNLYRSFGNLMEAWVAEDSQCSDSEWLANTDEDSPTPSSDLGTNLRSESVDSGVETASCDTSFHATSCSISTHNAEMDTFTPEREGDGLSRASTSQSPVLFSPLPSSSSLHLYSGGAQETSITSHQKLEQALQRIENNLQKDNPGPLTVTETLKRQPRPSFLPKRHTSEIVRGQRSGNFGLKKTVNPLVSMRQMYRRPQSMSFDTQPVQTRLKDLDKEEGKELSPGLSYLEQVCQMLEDIARKQMQNQALQTEMNPLQCHQDMEALDTCLNDSKTAEENLSSSQRHENAKKGFRLPRQRKDFSHRHIRQRSASFTTISMLQSGQSNADCRGQHLSIDDLLRMAEEDHEVQESKKEKNDKIYKIWKLKFGSLRKEESIMREKNSQQTQPSEKNSARRRLSQLFRKDRRKTTS